jgi:excisionase family DNA binding protein
MVDLRINPEDDIPTRIERCAGALDAVRLGAFLGLKKSTIYQMASDGRIPHYRIGSNIRFDPRIIAEWLRSLFIPTAA